MAKDDEKNVAAALDDRQSEIPVFSKVCTYCYWWKPLDGRSCAAYTKRNSIPMPIWMAEVTHVFPYAGDHGIQFKSAPDAKKLPPNIAGDLKKREADEHASE